MPSSSRSRLDRLRSLALQAHEGQLDRQGVPYREHILAVTDAVSEPAKPVALFHDAIEDGKLTRGEVAEILNGEAFAAVDLLTRGSESYAVYINRIRDARGRIGELAREVKRADLAHNLGRLTPELESLRGRYEAAREVLGG